METKENTEASNLEPSAPEKYLLPIHHLQVGYPGEEEVQLMSSNNPKVLRPRTTKQGSKVLGQGEGQQRAESPHPPGPRA